MKVADVEDYLTLPSVVCNQRDADDRASKPEREVRRKDVGRQLYASGSGQPTYAARDPDRGSLPTAAALRFLTHQYRDDRLAPLTNYPSPASTNDEIQLTACGISFYIQVQLYK